MRAIPGGCRRRSTASARQPPDPRRAHQDAGRRALRSGGGAGDRRRGADPRRRRLRGRGDRSTARRRTRRAVAPDDLHRFVGADGRCDPRQGFARHQPGVRRLRRGEQGLQPRRLRARARRAHPAAARLERVHGGRARWCSRRCRSNRPSRSWRTSRAMRASSACSTSRACCTRSICSACPRLRCRPGCTTGCRSACRSSARAFARTFASTRRRPSKPRPACSPNACSSAAEPGFRLRRRVGPSPFGVGDFGRTLILLKNRRLSATVVSQFWRRLFSQLHVSKGLGSLARKAQ